MKIASIASITAVLALTVPAAATAAEAKDPHAQHMTAGAKAPPAAPHKASGTVKKIDPAAGTVTLAHGAVPALKWPPMTMSFKVADKALFDKLAVNKKIDFEFVEQGSAYVVTGIK
jgi:Cu/Ag efflux protein CusF